MFSICQTTHPATTIEHSIQCNFYNLSETNLVVAGANQLQVYKIRRETTFKLNNHDNDQPAPDPVWLELAQSFELYGSVASLQKVTFGSKSVCKRDSIVISFHDAKLSIVEYNPESHDLKTVSMHYFEDDNLRDGCVTNHMHPPLVRVDPENRCIATLIYGRRVMVIPVDKDEDLEEDLERDLYNSLDSDEDEAMAPAYDDDDYISKPVAGQVATLKPAVTPSFKSPVLPSYQIDLNEETCGEKIENIADIQFLHNYNDPTLVILYEPNRTWSGRVAMRQDTYSMVALSMNIHQRLQPIIWTVTNLPYDALKILPVPKPIGGLLILACNELLYLNQSVPAFGISLNSFTKESSAFPLNNQDNDVGSKTDQLGISLDLAQAVFLSYNKILFILKDGDVFLVTLFNDDMRSIKNFHFERVGSTVQPNCLTLCANNLLFVGSHVGDSVLVELVGDLKSSQLLDATAAATDGDDLDSLMSTEEKEQPLLLHEHDRLLSSSASGRICYGEAPNVAENLPRHEHRDPFVELITTAGQHKSGSICVFQQTIKPVVQDTYELKDCGDLWTMKPSIHSEPVNYRLILNRELETMVFSTKGELLELKRDECHFETQEPTILMANIGEDNLTLQVMSSSIQLISNDKSVHQVRLEGTICDACVADPHIIALTTTGSIYHLQLIMSSPEEDAEEIGGRQFGLSWHDLGQLTSGQIVSLSLYKDLSGLFTCKTGPNNNEEPTFWLLTADTRGVLEIFSVPSFNSVYSVDSFPSAPAVLADNMKLFVTDLDQTAAMTRELLMVGMGPEAKKPILFVRSDYELVIYEAYPFSDVDINGHLKIRFKKIDALLLKTILGDDAPIEPQPNMLAITDGRPPSSNGRSSRRRRNRHRNSSHHHQQQQQQQQQLQDQQRQSLRLRERFLMNRHWLHQFHQIGHYSGVFLAGFRPHWFIVSRRGALRAHPMNVEGAIYAFSEYADNNFIYYTENRELRIARLPQQLDLDSHWPVKKLRMEETVHFVNYHVERKVYCVVTSSPVLCLKLMRVGAEPDTMKVEELEQEPGYIPFTIEKFRLRLYDPEKWELIPDCEIEFEEWEQVTCVKNVLLASEGTTSGLKGYIALSTNYCYGEDVPNRGRIWILDLIEVVPEPDQPLTKNKIKKVYCQEQKGPVTTLSHACGLLMSAVGQKIYLWQLKEGQLDGVAFIDTQIYIHCATSVKNLILVSDVCKSVSLLRYQQETRTLSMVCRDSKPLEIFACDFLVDNELLNFVVTDSERNIIIYAYEPEHEDSHGGTRLLRRADLHLGAHVTSFCRLRAKVPNALARDPVAALHSRRRHLTMFCTVDGAIGFLLPVDEQLYRQFQMLQNEMTLALPHAAGLNPKAWRTVKQARPSVPNPCKLILDGDLVRRFLLLSAKERNELAKKIGTSPDQLLADMQLVHESSLFF